MCVCVEMRSVSRMTLKPFSLQRLLTYGTTFRDIKADDREGGGGSIPTQIRVNK